MPSRGDLISVREAGVVATHTGTIDSREPLAATKQPCTMTDVDRNSDNTKTAQSCALDARKTSTYNGDIPEPYPQATEPRTISKDDDDTTLLPDALHLSADKPLSSVHSAAPDGGWGWVVCTGAFLCNVITDGMLFSFGVFFIELLADFGESKGRTALVGSMLMGTHLFLGPVVSVMVNMWGVRPVTMAGALIATIAFAVSTLAPNLTVLTFTYGIVGGLGISMVYIPSILVVGFYFDKRRALANGITSSGSGIGTFIYSPLCNYLQQRYTWRGALLILAGLVLNCVAFGALYRPLHETKKKRALLTERAAEPNAKFHEVALTEKPVPRSKYLASAPFKSKSHHCLPLIGPSEMGDIVAIRLPRENVHYDSDSNIDNQSRTLFKPPLYSAAALGARSSVSTPNLQMRKRAQLPVLYEGAATSKPLSRKDCFYSGSVYRLVGSRRLDDSRCSLQGDGRSIEQQTVTKSSRWREMSQTMHKLLSVSLLKNVVFVILTLSGVMWTTHSTILTILPDHAIQYGCAEADAALLIALIGIANTVGRVVIGWIADRPSVRAIWVNAAALLIGGVVCTAIAFTRCHALLAVEAAIFGVCMATWVSLRPIVLVEMLGIDKLTNAFGLLAMFQGIAFSVGPPAAGLLYDHTQSYRGPFCLAGFAFFSSGVILLLLYRFTGPDRDEVKSSSERTDSSVINA